MREVKYRGWLKPTKKMFAVHAMSPTVVEERKNGMGFQYDRREVVLMQYPGLKDMNGNEICEGDILRTRTELEPAPDSDLVDSIIGVVKIENGMTFLVGKQESGYKGQTKISEYRSLLMCPQYLFSVIGDAYNNPELLGVSPD